MNNETIDYTLICNDKQEIVLNKNCHHSVECLLSLYEFSLWGLISCPFSLLQRVRIIEVIVYKECMGIFPGPSELSVLERFDCTRDL